MAEAAATTVLATIGGIEVSVAESVTPWTLDIDALAIPVVNGRLGQLGETFLRFFPAAPLYSIDVSRIEPTSPQVVDVGAVVTGPGPRWLILSAAGFTSDLSMSAIRAAAGAGATRLAMPFVDSEPVDPGQVAQTTLAYLLGALPQLPRGPITSLILFDGRRGVADALVAAARQFSSDSTRSAEAAASYAEPIELSGTARRLLVTAAAQAKDPEKITPQLVWFGALVDSQTAGRRDVAVALLDQIPAARRRRVFSALSGNERFDDTVVMPEWAQRTELPELAVVRAALAVALRVNSRAVRQRHVLAAAALDPAGAAAIATATGWTPAQVRANLRRAIGDVLPTEFPEVWDEILLASAATPTAQPSTKPAPVRVSTAEHEAPTESAARADTGPTESAARADTGPTESAARADTGPTESAARADTGPTESAARADTGPTTSAADPASASAPDPSPAPDSPSDPLQGSLAPEAPAEELAGGFTGDIVDPDKGIPLEQDHLGLGTYVTMLATVIADRDTPMPLSIGLFGEWGSGKSYFMGLLHEQIDRLSDSDDGAYLNGIEHIVFNAWHYADTNLWASLGNTIFEKLAGSGPSTDARRQQLRAELVEKLDRRQALDEAAQRAEQETEKLRQRAQQARNDRAEAGRNLLAAMTQSPEIQKTLKQVWRRLGVADAATQENLLVGQARGLATDGVALRGAVAGRRGPAVAAVLVVSATLLGLALFTPPAARHWLAGSGVLGLVAAATAVAGFLARARSGVQTLTRVMTQTRDLALASADTDPVVVQRYAELDQAITREQVVTAQRDEAITRVGQIGRELADLDPGRQWYGFLADRAVSDDYRSQLGLVSTIRRDFTKLIALMDDWRAHPDEHGDHLPVNRIVLYIDDLDRCSPKQVMDVLQAVHLLLALNLFVVVVGVDPRWLLQSLRQQYRDNFAGEQPSSAAATGGGEWAAEPLDYLEKIFNIPFVLPRMTSDSFAKLIYEISADTQRLADRRHHHATPLLAGAGLFAALAAAQPFEGGDGDETEQARSDTPAGPRPALPGVASLLGVIPVEEGSAVARARTGRAVPARRGLTPAELTMLGALGPVVESPREAKRLLNLYRTLRSTRDLSRASDFLERDGGGGEYQAVIVLLGILSAQPALLGELLLTPPGTETVSRGGLCYRDPDMTWADAVAGLRPKKPPGWTNLGHDLGRLTADQAADWTSLLDNLGRASALVTLPDLAPFQVWGPRIARFSFVLSPLAASVQPRSDDAAARVSPTEDAPPVAEPAPR